MDTTAFRTVDGRLVTAVTGDEMAAVDRVAVEDIGLDLPRMILLAARYM